MTKKYDFELAEEELLADVQIVILTVMKKKGISKAELARRLGVSAAAVSKSLNLEDSENLSVRRIARIFEALEDEIVLSSWFLKSAEQRNEGLLGKNKSPQLYWNIHSNDNSCENIKMKEIAVGRSCAMTYGTYLELHKQTLKNPEYASAA